MELQRHYHSQLGPRPHNNLFVCLFFLLLSPFIARNGEGHNIVRLIRAIKNCTLPFLSKKHTYMSTQHAHHDCNHLNLLLTEQNNILLLLTSIQGTNKRSMYTSFLAAFWKFSVQNSLLMGLELINSQKLLVSLKTIEHHLAHA